MADGPLDGLKRAFLWHWHLLVLGAGAALALLSGHPDVALPIMAAAEIAYLGFLGTNRRFLKVLEGGAALRRQQDAAAAAQRQLDDLLGFLAPDDAHRFDRLRRRCAEFDRLRRHLDATAGKPVVSHLRTDSLERMLWLFLRLLHHKSGIDRFLASTDIDELRNQLTTADEQLAAAESTGRAERLVRSLAEMREAIRQRIANHDAAIESRDLLAAELDKTEQLIEHINEIGMTHGAPDDLGIQIDSIADSMASSERALGDLRSDLLTDTGAPPPILAAAIRPPPLPLAE